jgi:hypothetical protein
LEHQRRFHARLVAQKRLVVLLANRSRLWVYFLLTPINLIRTFYQVHGYILPLIQKYSVLIIFICLSGGLTIAGCIRL